MKNILLIGGAGFIGSNLIRKLVDTTSYRLFVYETHFANTSKLDEYEGRITIIKGVLSEFDLLQSIIVEHKIDTVIHLVSTLIPGSTYDDYKREFENIIFPTIRLMGLCAEKNVKFIFFSSGGTIYGNHSHGKFHESDTEAPISYYGLSKKIIEESILFEHRRGQLRYLIIRPSNPFGPGQALNGAQGLIAVALGKAIAHHPIAVWGDGSSVRDYIYIDDLANATFQLLDKEIENDTINIGSGVGYSINEILNQFQDIVSEKLVINYEKSRSVDVSSVILDISKLVSYIDFTITPLDEGIKLFYNYVKTKLKVE